MKAKSAVQLQTLYSLDHRLTFVHHSSTQLGSLGLEMAAAQRTRPRAVVGAPRRAAWQLKSALRHSAVPRTIIFLHLV